MAFNLHVLSKKIIPKSLHRFIEKWDYLRQKPSGVQPTNQRSKLPLKTCK